MPWNSPEAAGSGMNVCISKSSIYSIWLGLHFTQEDFLLKGEIPAMMAPTSKRGSLPDLLISAFLKAPQTSLAAVTKQEL